jgi:hypothetical protein
MKISGICTFCISQDRDVIAGYLLSEQQKFRVLLFPAANPPKMHKCVIGSFLFFDLKVVEKDILIGNCQSNQQEYLQFSTVWNESVQDQRQDSDSVSFKPSLIKVGEDARGIVEKMFPAFVEDSDCTVCVGELEVSVDLEE